LVPYQGPSSDYVVVKMIPDSRLPPRHLHVVHTGKTSAVIKWESPYDSPDQDLVSGLSIADSLTYSYHTLGGLECRGSIYGAGNQGLEVEFTRLSPHFCVAKDGVFIGMSS
jgi:hypothetical protein